MIGIIGKSLSNMEFESIYSVGINDQIFNIELNVKIQLINV